MRASVFRAGTGPVPAGTDRYRPQKARGAGTGRYRASGTGPHRREKFPGSRRYKNASTGPLPAGMDRYRSQKARGAGTGRYRASGTDPSPEFPPSRRHESARACTGLYRPVLVAKGWLSRYRPVPASGTDPPPEFPRSRRYKTAGAFTGLYRPVLVAKGCSSVC
jgi:hypothetical protein